MVRGAQHLRERLCRPVRSHGDADLVLGHGLAEDSARPVGASNFRRLADPAHVAIGPSLLFGVNNFDSIENLEVRHTRNVVRNAGQLVCLGISDFGGTRVPLTNGSADAGLDALPAGQVRELCGEIEVTSQAIKRRLSHHKIFFDLRFLFDEEGQIAFSGSLFALRYGCAGSWLYWSS